MTGHDEIASLFDEFSTSDGARNSCCAFVVWEPREVLTTQWGVALSTERLKTMKLLIEIRAAEGGADAKLLVRDQFAIYANAARLHRL